MAGFSNGLSLRRQPVFDPDKIISRLESEEPLPDDDPRTRNGGLDPSRQQDLQQIQFYAQARQSGQMSDRAWGRLIQRNPRSATLFSSVGVNPEVAAAKQRSEVLSKYFSPEQPGFEGNVITGGEDDQMVRYENRPAVPAKEDFANARRAALQMGDVALAEKLSLQEEKISGKSPAARSSEAKLIQVDSQDDKGNKITELVDPHSAKTVRTFKGTPKLLSDTHVGKLQKYSDAFDRIDGISATFDDRFGGFKSQVAGQASQEYRKRFGDDVPFVQWWQTYQEETNEIRKELFGSALTATEKTEFDRARIHPGMSAPQIKANLARQRSASLRAAQKLAKPFTSQNFDRRMVVDSLGRHADTILSEKPKTTKEVLEESNKPKSSSQTGWTAEKETRYQELLRKRNAQ